MGIWCLSQHLHGIQNIVATIDYISPTVKQGENTVLVHATLPKSIQMIVDSDSTAPVQNNALKPGVSITISNKTGERKDVAFTSAPFCCEYSEWKRLYIYR